jgi:hypothetical protein
MRLTVRRVIEAAALYPDRTGLKAEYPELEDEDIAQALGSRPWFHAGTDLCAHRRLRLAHKYL